MNLVCFCSKLHLVKMVGVVVTESCGCDELGKLPLYSFSLGIEEDGGYPHNGHADKNPYPTIVPIRILIRTTAIISALS